MQRSHESKSLTQSYSMPGTQPERPASCSAFALRRERRQLPVRRTDQHRGAPRERRGLDPVGEALGPSGADPVLVRLGEIAVRALGRGETARVLFLGLPEAFAVFGRALEQDAGVVEELDLERVADIRIAPRRLRRLVVGRDRRQHRRVGRPLLRDGGGRSGDERRSERDRGCGGGDA